LGDSLLDYLDLDSWHSWGLVNETAQGLYESGKTLQFGMIFWGDGRELRLGFVESVFRPPAHDLLM